MKIYVVIWDYDTTLEKETDIIQCNTYTIREVKMCGKDAQWLANKNKLRWTTHRSHLLRWTSRVVLYCSTHYTFSFYLLSCLWLYGKISCINSFLPLSSPLHTHNIKIKIETTIQHMGLLTTIYHHRI